MSKLLRKLHCYIFGHIWVADGCPDADGTQHRHCDICGKKVVTNVSKPANLAIMRYKVLLYDETIALTKDQDIALMICKALPTDNYSYKSVIDAETGGIVYEWCY